MIEREHVSGSEPATDENVSHEATGEEEEVEEERGVGEDDASVAKAYGDVTTTVARNWNDVDLIDWTTNSQLQTVPPQPPHGAGSETASSHPENAGGAVTPPPQQWNLMDSDLFQVDASAPADSAADGVSEISAPVGASEIARTKSLGHMEIGRSENCGAATAQVTDTGKEIGGSMEQKPLWKADNPAYNRSKSAAHVMIDSPPSLHKPLLGAAIEEQKDQEAREEAKRMAERGAERAHRELVKLANPEPQSSMHTKEWTKAAKGVSRFFHRIMVNREEKVHNPLDTLETREANHSPVDARQAKLVMPRSTFLKDLIAPIHASSKAAIKSRPHHLASKQELHFETVESHQNDGPSWTVEEYMIRNNRWKEVEEVGGIENFLFNLQFDDFDDIDGDDDNDDDDGW